jgi:L-threonylcarbamoyladenylate synthase
MKKKTRNFLLHAQEVPLAASLLRQGEVVAFPTETVYGLGALLHLPDAVHALYRVKGRPADNPLIVHVARLEALSRLAVEIPRECWLLAEAFWPGPLTIILKRHPDFSGAWAAGLPTIAVRFPAHPIAQELIEEAGAPLVAPSANLSGTPSATLPEHVRADFEGRIAAVIDGGRTSYGLESTVIHLSCGAPTVMRPGAISPERLAEVLGRPITLFSGVANSPSSPGMKYRHYAPRAPIKLFFSQNALQAHIRGSPHVRRTVFTPAPETLYAELRRADALGHEEILVFCDAHVQDNLALMDRLRRAL